METDEVRTTPPRPAGRSFPPLDINAEFSRLRVAGGCLLASVRAVPLASRASWRAAWRAASCLRRASMRFACSSRRTSMRFACCSANFSTTSGVSWPNVGSSSGTLRSRATSLHNDFGAFSPFSSANLSSLARSPHMPGDACCFLLRTSSSLLAVISSPNLKEPASAPHDAFCPETFLLEDAGSSSESLSSEAPPVATTLREDEAAESVPSSGGGIGKSANLPDSVVSTAPGENCAASFASSGLSCFLRSQAGPSPSYSSGVCSVSTPAFLPLFSLSSSPGLRPNVPLRRRRATKTAPAVMSIVAPAPIAAGVAHPPSASGGGGGFGGGKGGGGGGGGPPGGMRGGGGEGARSAASSITGGSKS